MDDEKKEICVYDAFSCEKIINEYLENVSEEMKKNPLFYELFEKEIIYLTREYFVPSDDRHSSLMELCIAKDGRSFTISSSVGSLPECQKDLKNKSYSRVQFSLDNDDNIEVLRATGIFYPIADYMNGLSQREREFISRYKNKTSSNLITMMEILCNHKTVLKDGKEIESSNYFDRIPLRYAYDNSPKLKTQTISHIPQFGDGFPKASIEVMPMAVKLSRDPKNLALISYWWVEGEQNGILLYPASPKNKALIRIDEEQEPYAEYNGNGYKAIGSYSGRTIGEIEKDLTIAFYSKNEDIYGAK